MVRVQTNVGFPMPAARALPAVGFANGNLQGFEFLLRRFRIQLQLRNVQQFPKDLCVGFCSREGCACEFNFGLERLSDQLLPACGLQSWKHRFTNHQELLP